jgi:hypothetical protein
VIMFRGLDISGWGLEFWVPGSRFANSRVCEFGGLGVQGFGGSRV